MWQRFLASSFSFRRFLLYDSSPQIGHDYLIVREDRIRLPFRGVLRPELRAIYDINACYEERLMPLSTVGRGNTGRAKKHGGVCNLYLLESDSDDQFHDTRCEVLNGCSDPGTGKAVSELSVLMLDRFRNAYSADDEVSFISV